MPTSYSTSHSLPFLTDFAAKDRELVQKALNNQEARQRKASESRAQKADDVLEDLRRQLRDLLGAKELAALREGIKRERLAFHDLWEPPGGLHHDYPKAKKAGQEKVEALLRKHGASPEKLAKLGRQFEERLKEVLSVTDGKVVPGYHLLNNVDKWLSLSPLHENLLPGGVLAPPPDDPNDPHRWFLFRPPFFGFLFSFVPQNSGSFLVDRLLFLSPPVGLVGHEVTMDCDDPSDFSAASATAETQIGFSFDPPTTGVVEVVIDAQSTMATDHLDVEDQFGFSNAWCYQNNFLMMNVLHPNVAEPSLAAMSAFHADSDGDDVSVNAENLTRGAHYFAHLFSAGPVPGGQSVILTVGTRNFDITHTDDMKLHSRSNFQWFINSVEVRIAP